MTINILLFTTPGCPYCRRAKTLLTEKEAEFFEVDVSEKELREQMVELSSGKKTVPQIFLGGLHVGGYDDLKHMEDKGNLDEVLEKVLGDSGDLLNEEIRGIADVYGKTGKQGEEESQVGVVGGEEETVVVLESSNGQTEWNYTRLDALVEKMSEESSGLNIKSRMSMLKMYSRCFLGNEFVEWLIEGGICEGEEEAVDIGQKMMDFQLLHHVTRSEVFENKNHYYRFQNHESEKVINMRRIWISEDVREASEVSSTMRSKFLRLFDQFISDDGNHVDYKGMSKSSEWHEFVNAAAELQVVDVSTLNNDQKLAFWLNLYNVLCIAGYIEVGVPTNAMQRGSFYKSVSFNVGGYDYSLDDIEHGVLRVNAVPPGRLTRLFGSDDPRRFNVVTERDPRIHFSLVCGAKSCPAIRVFSEDNIQDALTWAAEGFCEENVIVEGNKIHLSMILKWYGGDFGSNNEEVIRRCLEWLDDDKRTQIEILLEGKWSVSWIEYDWTVNE